MKKTLLSAIAILRTLWPTRAPVVEFFNADEIQLQTKLYAGKGGAYIGSHTNSVTLDMARGRSTSQELNVWPAVRLSPMRRSRSCSASKAAARDVQHLRSG